MLAKAKQLKDGWFSRGSPTDYQVFFNATSVPLKARMISAELDEGRLGKYEFQSTSYLYEIRIDGIKSIHVQSSR